MVFSRTHPQIGRAMNKSQQNKPEIGQCHRRPMTHLQITEPTNSKFTERTHRRFSRPSSPLLPSNRNPIIPPQTIPPSHLFPTNPRQKRLSSDPLRRRPSAQAIPNTKITERTRARLRPTAPRTHRPLDRSLLPYVIVVSIQSETSSRFTPIGYERKVSGEF